MAILFTGLIGEYGSFGTMTFGFFCWTDLSISIFHISTAVTLHSILFLDVGFLKSLVKLHIQLEHHIEFPFISLSLIFQDSDVVLVHLMLISEVNL